MGGSRINLRTVVSPGRTGTRGEKPEIRGSASSVEKLLLRLYFSIQPWLVSSFSFLKLLFLENYKKIIMELI